MQSDGRADLDQLASVPNAFEAWSDVHETLDKFSCVVIDSYLIRREQDDPPFVLRLDLAGRGTAVSARRQTKSLPSAWILTMAETPAGLRISDAQTEVSYVARMIVSAATNDE